MTQELGTVPGIIFRHTTLIISLPYFYLSLHPYD
jgi:hypothetical protein